ncbi:prolipoprotein diacylglyceryl transferase [Labilibacter sediminis]|nr:prolipoprotein diacylglyceryl transferase [Labilibacter sediminis]
MESLFILPNQSFQSYYNLFYELAFLVVFVFFIWEGLRRKLTIHQWVQWILVATSVHLFFIIGTKIFTYSGQDWNYFFSSFRFPPTQSKTVFGGLVLALAGIGLAKLWLRYSFKVLDAYAIAIPIGMAIQRVGCLLVGCCFGNNTSSFWGIHYGRFSPVFFYQVQSGAIEHSSSHALAVHPIPLLIIIYCLLISFIVCKNRGRFKASGNLTLFSIGLLFSARFIIEFIRHPFTNGSLGIIFWGLKLIQWALLLLVATIVIVVFIRERKFRLIPKNNVDSPPNYISSISFIFFLTLVFYLGRNWFGGIEKISFIIMVIPLSLVLLWQIFQYVVVPGFRFACVILLILSFVIMSQTVDIKEKSDSTNTYTPYSWNSFSIGYGTGNYEDIDYGCEGEVIDRTKHTYGVTRFEYNRHFSLKENQLGTLGMRTYFGNDKVKAAERGYHYERKLSGVNPYFLYDFKPIGIGVGFHYGQFIYKESYGKKELLPMLYFRAWSRKKVYTELFINDHSMLYTPVSNFRVGLGIALEDDFSSVHFGITDVYGQGSGYVSSRILIYDNLLFEPNLSFQLQDAKGFQGGFGIHYLFGRTSKK